MSIHPSTDQCLQALGHSPGIDLVNVENKIMDKIIPGLDFLR